MESGEPQDLIDVLAPDVVLVSDGGGLKQAALRPIVGAERIIPMLVHGLPKVKGALTAELASINGHPALIIRLDGKIDGIMAIVMEGAHYPPLLHWQPAEADAD